MEANGRLQGSNNKCLWPECLVEAAVRYFKGLNAGKRQARMPEQQRAMKANDRWPECLIEAAARNFKGLTAGKRQVLNAPTEGHGGKRQVQA